MREAPALVLIDKLLEAGCRVRAYDPAAVQECKRRIGEKIYYACDMYDAVLDADVLMLVTEWKEFRLPSWAVIKKTMAQQIVFTLVGLALAGLGGVLLMNNTAALTHALNIEQGVLGVAVIGVGLVLPEYVRVARKYWMNTQKPVSMHLTLATGNLGLLLMIGLSAVISPIIVTFAGAYLLLACVVAIIVFGILFYVGGEVGKIKAILFLAGFALVFVLLMKFSLH